ncbi:hypothetical protein [Catalinimonas alkaloidigena]|uniref:hypothetical protein n=1 Tax=Catalinimonas alkaloidigena TaxID=1075417 RepID=UPI003B8A7D78
MGQSYPEFKRFVGYAIRSLAEVIPCLYKAKMHNYNSEEQFTVNYKLRFCV